MVNNLFYKGNDGDTGADLFTGLNRKPGGISYEKVDFDKTGFADQLGIGIGQGAAGYFSSNNTLTTIHNDLIPDAKGYPITQTRYSRDGTGRVIQQGGVGPQFQLGGDHATKYMYASCQCNRIKKTIWF